MFSIGTLLVFSFENKILIMWRPNGCGILKLSEGILCKRAHYNLYSYNLDRPTDFHLSIPQSSSDIPYSCQLFVARNFALCKFRLHITEVRPLFVFAYLLYRLLSWKTQLVWCLNCLMPAKVPLNL